MKDAKMKLANVTATACLGLALSAGVARAECGEVSLTQMDWASSGVVTAVSEFLLEQGYGCDVSLVPSSTNPAITSVAETNEPDILTELWVNAAPAYDGLVEQGKIVPLTDVLSDGGQEGWWVPKYLVDEHPELATLDGVLANPELLGGRFHNCPDGWACRTVNDHIAEAAGLEDAGYEIFHHGSGETLATSIAAAFEDRGPWLGYYWAPTAILGKYPMVMVDLGPYKPEVHKCNSEPDCADPGVSSYPASKVLTVVTDDFREDNPEAAELMAKLSFTNDLMSEILAWRDDNNASFEEAAVYFLTNYKDTWSAWLDDAARERLSAILQ